MPAQTPSSPNLQLSPISLSRMIWKHKLAVLLIAGSLSAAASLVVYRLPAIYKSEATILVDSQKIPERYVSSTVNADLSDRLATISQEILSSTALKKIIDDFDLYRAEQHRLSFEEVIEQMRKDITITTEKGWSGNKPGAFHVAFSGRDPNVVAGVANRLANLFVEENLRAREVQAEGTSEFLVTELGDAKKKLDELEAQVSHYKMEHNGELPQQENELVASLGRLQLVLQGDQDAIARAHENKVILESSLDMMQSAGPAVQPRTGDAPRQQRAPEKSAAAQDLERLIETKQSQLDLLRVQYTDSYPEVRQLQTEVARLRASARGNGAAPAAPAAKTAAARTDAPARVAAPPQETPRTFQINAQIKLIADEISRRTAEEESVKKQIADIQSRLEKLPVREQEMAGLTRDYEMSKANYRSLLDKKLSADMAAEMERRQKAERFTILDPARVPVKPYKPNRPLLYGSSCAVAIALALAFAIGSDLRSDVLLGEWELPPDLKVLGRVPLVAAPTAPKNPSPASPPKRKALRWSAAILTCFLIGLGAAFRAGWLTLPRFL